MSREPDGARDRAGQAAPEPERRGWVYAVSWWLVRRYVRAVYRPRESGLEHVPQRGAALLVANHQSVLDILVLGTALRRPVCFVARESLGQNRALAWFMGRCHVIPIQRGSADRAALSAIQERLRAGRLVAVFPEGTRSTDGRVGKFRRGAQVAAKRTRAPLIPVALSGTGRAWPRTRVRPPLLGRRSAGVQLAVGPALDPGNPDALERARTQIASLAPLELSPPATR